MIRKGIILITLLFTFFSFDLNAQSCTCDASVPTFDVDLTATPDTTWDTTSTRSAQCCSANPPTQCIRFEVDLNPKSTELDFDVTNPGPPGGAFYQIDCGDSISLGDSVCISGRDSLCITFCLSGNDSPDYTISVGQGYSSADTTKVREGCTDSLMVTGMQEETISWTSVSPGNDGDYNNYLSCTDSCDTTLVSPDASAPDTILYEVTGDLVGCSASTFTDTVPVITFPTMTVDVIPDTGYVCVGDTDATLTADVTGGAPPYDYQWSNGDTTQSITVGTGSYTVTVTDSAKGCSAVEDSAIVLNSDTVP
ncbi:MAG: SprB repeat-containing protein, partial [Flavobacteriales bacterium]